LGGFGIWFALPFALDCMIGLFGKRGKL
jgi:hypothetical protein